jgi:hemoglobin
LTDPIYSKLTESGVRRLVDRFYDLMDSLPEAAGIRKLHPESLAGSRDKLFWFLVGWLGGPPLYVERFGHPRLRARHLPFPIGVAERDAWLLCMRRALADTVEDPAVRAAIDEPITRLADHMRNGAPT